MVSKCCKAPRKIKNPLSTKFSFVCSSCGKACEVVGSTNVVSNCEAGHRYNGNPCWVCIEMSAWENKAENKDVKYGSEKYKEYEEKIEKKYEPKERPFDGTDNLRYTYPTKSEREGKGLYINATEIPNANILTDFQEGTTNKFKVNSKGEVTPQPTEKEEVAICRDCHAKFTDWLSDSRECPECEGVMLFLDYLGKESNTLGTTMEEDLKIRFHAFSIKMAEKERDGELDYRDVEKKIADWWLEKLSQSKAETIKECISKLDEYYVGSERSQEEPFDFKYIYELPDEAQYILTLLSKDIEQ